ncbi:MAG: hypothetical protein P0Y53_17245 [Candidatus Pseudobacter hemicellulosilyticus]|uniref:Uncharacterized protein n=1 Tax=Candidatus Pseudobacter hemicellulosilyticus TaxID=3121375 RepID=A0AAJ6BE47_9BACT|nr:MAG: hypothetical protein P0Y53_17245 [Pseudobacter sp.]
MDIKENIVNKLLSNISVPLICQKRAPGGMEYEYILDGIELRIVPVDNGEEGYPQEVYGKWIAMFFAYDLYQILFPKSRQKQLS